MFCFCFCLVIIHYLSEPFGCKQKAAFVPGSFLKSQLLAISQDCFLRISQLSGDVNSVLILSIISFAFEALLSPVETVCRDVPFEDGEQSFFWLMFHSIPIPIQSWGSCQFLPFSHHLVSRGPAGWLRTLSTSPSLPHLYQEGVFMSGGCMMGE